MAYIIWLLIFAILPLVFIWLKYFNLLWRYKQTLASVVLIAFLIFIPWDIYAVRSGIWLFPYSGNTGIIIMDLPLEEYLYTVLIPLLAASITLIVKYKFQGKKD
ncbi:MAG: lycopene cyclase domain-containing protein [Candidatus Daviesbacteria bacterium]|nr:lycopene cyclase domain-containing protein [Candidatus Daviesbacteria bacterium]